MASITSSLQRIKDNPLAMITPQLIESICREHGYTWRSRELDPADTLSLFMRQVIQRNCSCSEVRLLAKSRFSPQAYCEARSRLPLHVYQDLFHEVWKLIVPHTRSQDHLWHGHRTFHIDGSTFSMPDTPELRNVFGVPSKTAEGCTFPVAHLLVLFSAATGLLMDMWAAPLYTSDLASVPEAHLHLDEGDILIGDDTFSGYPHLAMLIQQGLHGLFPSHHLRKVDFTKSRPHGNEKGMVRSRWIKSLGREDQLVEYFKEQKPQRMSREEFDALPDSIIVRELRRTVQRPGLGKVTLTMVTTLLDPVKYPAADLLELRLRRWDVETDIRHLKITMQMDVLRCKSEEGIRKELAIFGIVYNLVRQVMLQGAARRGVAVSRISFIDAYKWLRHAKPDDVLPLLMVNRYRPNRIEPRCKKRRPKQFDLMNKPRDVLRTLLKNKGKAA